MYIAKFKVTLEEPMVVPGKDKTEPSLNCLDFIPGNRFLGLVAGALYNKNKPQITLDLFHNGNVQFSNAYLSYKDIQSKPIPSVWYKEKERNLSEGIYFYHQIKDKDWKSFATQGIQIEQERAGYFVQKDGKIIILNAKKGVVLKSAYNESRRSSKSEQMYLYEYLEAGQEFIFYVSSMKKSYLTKISNVLKGKKGVSKSKSSEFGGITIECLNSGITEEPKLKLRTKQDSYKVYALSDLVFINEHGEFTWDITPEHLGFENARINFDKSQLYFDKLHTRNGKRRTHDYDRLIIRKGSVFFVEKINNSDIIIKTEMIERGVGVFLSEGYGKIVIDPDFIDEFDKNVIKIYGDQEEDAIQVGQDKPKISEVLEERYKLELSFRELYKSVSEFIKKYRFLYLDISASQWGTIRSYIYQNKMDGKSGKDLYDSIFGTESGYLCHGKMSEKWITEKQRVLKKFLDLIIEENKAIPESIDELTNQNIEKLLLLSIEFPKQNKIN